MRTVVDRERGCGWRKPGGLYLMSDGVGEICSLLPIGLHVCPACGAGFRPARGWTWVNPELLLDNIVGDHQSDRHTKRCPLGKAGRLGDQCGLIWIGEAFYKTPADWMAEGKEMGFSRRIHNLPRGFVPGETWVLAAHRLAVPPSKAELEAWDLKADLKLVGRLIGEKRPAADASEPPKPRPGIFHIWRPSRVEYVVKGDETEEELAALEARGIEPVEVVREVDQETIEL